MSLTGTSVPLGTTSSQESIYLDSAPDLYIQDSRGSYRFNPDSDGFYWGMSGSATYPVYKIGCFSDFKWGDDLTTNDILCDAAGVQGVIQKRGSMHVGFTLKSLFPLSILTHLIRAGTVTSNATDGAEKMGIGDVTRKNLYWKAYFTKLYDEEASDFLAITLHKCQFVDSWEIAMPYGDNWNIPLQLRAFVDTSKPSAQQIATVIRVDTSVIV